MDYLGPTYAEVRQWIYWLRYFTPSDLADAMAVHEDVASRFIKAAIWHGMIKDTGRSVNGNGPRENIFAYVPPPLGSPARPRRVPEWRATEGCYSWAPRNRGMPVRLVKENRVASSTGGQRLKIKLREQRYKEMEEARRKRKEEQRNKRIKRESYLD